MTKEEFITFLHQWLQENGEVLLEIYFPHSGGGGDEYLLKTAAQIDSVIAFTLSQTEHRGDGQAIITAFSSNFFPLRGIVDEPFIDKIRSSWDGKRWYSIIAFEDIFPEPIHTVCSGNTQKN